MKTRAKRILSAALAALTAFSVFAGTDFGMTYEAQAAQASAEVPGLRFLPGQFQDWGPRPLNGRGRFMTGSA